MWKKKKGYLIVLLTMLFLASLIILFVSFGNVTGAKEPSERFKGYNKQRNKWTTGNLGKDYVEGDFVSYQLRIDMTSKVWGATEFSISFNFHQRSSKAIYVDGFDTSEESGFQWSTGEFLPDGKWIPDPGWGTHIPTPDADGSSPTAEPRITNYMDAWPPGTGDGTPPGSYPAEKRYFTVYGMPWAGDHIILFFRAHLALDIIWSEGLEGDLPTVLDGDEFETWTAKWKGASFATGSSRHFFLEYEGVGDKTIPIPIAQYPSTVINGHKYVNDVLFNTWQITLHGDLALYGPWTIPYDPDPVYTGTSPWTTGYFEFTGLIEGSYTVQEEDRSGYTHENILTSGAGTDEVKNVAEGWVSFDLPGGGTHTVNFYNTAFVVLTVSKTATPSWEQTLTWTIEKTATPTLSEIFVGDKTDVKYTINVTATPTANVYNVSGTITINNPNPSDVEVYATILDEVWDDGVLKGSQDLTPGGPILIPSGISTYDYSITLSDIVVDKTYTNKVTVNVTAPVSEIYYAEETFVFTGPTDRVDEAVEVRDSLQGDLGTVYYYESPKIFDPYIKTFGPYSVVGSVIIENTANATGIDTGKVWTDSATVTIIVYDITVSKTAETYWERVFEWSIEKSVEAAQLEPFINDQIEVKYTITVTKTVDTDTFSVSGTITIENKNPAKSAEVYVIDKIYDGASVVVASQDLGAHTILPGATLELPYEITFEAKLGEEYTNKAHVDLNNYHWDYLGSPKEPLGTTEFIGIKTFRYTEPDVKINDEVTVTDVQSVPDGLELKLSDYPPGGWATNVTKTFVVNKVVQAVELGTWDLRDQAYAEGQTETWSSGEKTLTFIVYDIDVTKTAEHWWKREFDWTIDKRVSPTELILINGETGTVTYTVTITKTLAGDEFKVNGTITIRNNNPEKSAVVNVTDVIHRPDGSVVASQYLGTYTIPPLGTLELDYEIFFTPEIGVEYTNVAHVDLENYRWNLDTTKNYLSNTEFTGDAVFTFTKPTKVIDDSAKIDEVEIVPGNFSAVVDWGPHGPPTWTFADSITIVFTKNITAVDVELCHWYEIPNTVTLTESDTGAVHEASALVIIHGGEPPPPPEYPPSFAFKHKSLGKIIPSGSTKTLTMIVYNTGVPQSRVYYLTFTAVIGDYSLLNFVGPPYTAHIKIYYNDGSTWEADVTGTITYEKFAGFDVMGDYRMVTWRVPTTYPDGPYLEGNYGGWLDARAEISFQITGAARGSTWLVFFPRATEDHHAVGVPLGSVTDKANIWESDGFWYPVHNSYDPYDALINTGHAFVNPSWAALPTTNEYAKTIRWIDII